MAKMAQHWNYRDILDVHPESDDRCVAIVGNGGQRCLNHKTVGYMNLIEAEGVLDTMDEIEDPSECRKHLDKLAYLTMCGNEHRKSEESRKEQCTRWNKRIDAFVARNELNRGGIEVAYVSPQLSPGPQDRAFISRISTIIDVDNPFIDSSLTTTWLPNGLPSPPRSSRGKSLAELYSPPETPESPGGARLELPVPQIAPITPPEAAELDPADVPTPEWSPEPPHKNDVAYTFAGDSPTLGCLSPPSQSSERLSDSDSDDTQVNSGLSLIPKEGKRTTASTAGLGITATESSPVKKEGFSVARQDKELPDLPVLAESCGRAPGSREQTSQPDVPERQIQFHQTKDGSWDLVLETTPEISLDLGALGGRTSASSRTLSVWDDTEDGGESPRGRRGSHQVWQRLRTSVASAVQKSPQRGVAFKSSWK